MLALLPVGEESTRLGQDDDKEDGGVRTIGVGLAVTDRFKDPVTMESLITETNRKRKYYKGSILVCKDKSYVYNSQLSRVGKQFDTFKQSSEQSTSRSFEQHKKKKRKTSNIQEDNMNNDSAAACKRRIRINSLQLNGFKVQCVESRYYISEVNDDVLREHFPENHIHIGDEVIKLNNEYCEHLRNVTKYIETTRVESLNLRSAATGEQYGETIRTSTEMTVQNIGMNSNRVLGKHYKL